MPEAPPAAPVAPSAPPTAPETPVTPAAPEADPTLYAGKFKGAASLEKGYRELSTALNLPPVAPDGKPLFGDGTPFKDAVELEKSYKVLESLQGRKAPATPPAPTAPATPPATKPDDLSIKGPPPPPVPTSTKKGYAKVLEAAGLAGKEAELAETYRKNGGRLNPEHYAAFEKVGRDPEEVDQVMAGQMALAQQEAAAIEGYRSEGAKIAGGPQQHDTLRQWALDPANIPTEKLARWNKQVESDPAFYPELVRLISIEYAEKNGSNGSRPLAGGGPGVATPTSAFTDPAEYHAVQAKIAAGTATEAEKKRFMATPSSIALRG